MTKVSKFFSHRWLFTTVTVGLVSFLGTWAVASLPVALATLPASFLGCSAHQFVTGVFGPPAE